MLKQSILKISLIILVLILAVTGIYFYQKTDDSTPPEFSMGGEALRGLISGAGFLRYEQADVDSYTAPNIAEKSTLSAGTHFYYFAPGPTDTIQQISVQEIIDRIQPVLHNTILFAYYNPITAEFITYPGVTETTNPEAINIPAYHAFVIKSSHASEIYGIKTETDTSLLDNVTTESVTEQIDAIFTNMLFRMNGGWVLLGVSNALQAYINIPAVGEIINSIFMQQGTTGNFVRLTPTGNLYNLESSEGYAIVWIKLQSPNRPAPSDLTISTINLGSEKYVLNITWTPPQSPPENEYTYTLTYGPIGGETQTRSALTDVMRPFETGILLSEFGKEYTFELKAVYSTGTSQAATKAYVISLSSPSASGTDTQVQSATCGNGTVDSGEECDTGIHYMPFKPEKEEFKLVNLCQSEDCSCPPGTAQNSYGTCYVYGGCGNGTLETANGEYCDPNASTISSRCQSDCTCPHSNVGRSDGVCVDNFEECGNGTIEEWEVCETEDDIQDNCMHCKGCGIRSSSDNPGRSSYMPCPDYN